MDDISDAELEEVEDANLLDITAMEMAIETQNEIITQLLAPATTLDEAVSLIGQALSVPNYPAATDIVSFVVRLLIQCRSLN